MILPEGRAQAQGREEETQGREPAPLSSEGGDHQPEEAGEDEQKAVPPNRA